MVALLKDSLMGFAWLGAAGVLLCSALQIARLIRQHKSDRGD